MTDVERAFDLTVRELRRDDRVHWLGDVHGTLGVYVRPTRVFLQGDVVLCWWNNGGGERLQVSGWSSKKRALIVQLMQSYARYDSWDVVERKEKAWHHTKVIHREPKHMLQHGDRVALRIVALPAELIRREPQSFERWSRPDMRRLALSGLRAAYSAPPVRTDSGDLLWQRPP